MSSFGTSFPGYVHDWLSGKGNESTALVAASMHPSMLGRQLTNTTLGDLLSVGVGQELNQNPGQYVGPKLR